MKIPYADVREEEDIKKFKFLKHLPFARLLRSYQEYRVNILFVLYHILEHFLLSKGL